MLKLPNEMMDHIQSFLPPPCQSRDAGALSCVCKKMNAAPQKRCDVMKSVHGYANPVCLKHAPPEHALYQQKIDTIMYYHFKINVGYTYVHFDSIKTADIARVIASKYLTDKSCCGGLGLQVKGAEASRLRHVPNMEGCCIQ